MTTKKVTARIVITLCMAIPILLVGENKQLSAADKAQIIPVTQRWYDLKFEASINGGDVSKFPEVLVDTPDYPLNDEHKQYIADILGPDAVQGAGLLTAMQAQYKNLGEGWALYKNAIYKAKQENRDVTQAEMGEIVKKMHGEIPPVVDENYSKTTLTLESIELTRANKVIVRFFDGICHEEYILVKVGDKWLISSGKTLRIDF